MSATPDLQNALTVHPEPNGFGARVTGVDLSTPLSADVVADIRALWLEHQVLYFPNQPMTHDALLQFARPQ